MIKISIGPVLSVIIIAIIFILVVRSSGNIIENILYESYDNDCRINYSSTGERNIIIRIDDIQVYYLKDVQKKMINDLLARKLTASLAVIPIDIKEDAEIELLLKKNKCEMEIGLHGYTNENFEFLNLSYEEADRRIKAGLNSLKEIDSSIITFIPPNNEISEEAKKAVYNNHIKIISSGFYNREFGFSVSTYDWESHKFMDYEKVLEECGKELDRNETCIIMIHPQDFATNNEFDAEKYNEYIKLLDNLDELNASIVTFRDLYYKNATILN